MGRLPDRPVADLCSVPLTIGISHSGYENHCYLAEVCNSLKIPASEYARTTNAFSTLPTPAAYRPSFSRPQEKRQMLQKL